MEQRTIDIFNYFDYREYLRDLFKIYKENHPGFTFRSFARDANIQSQTYLNRVLTGSRNLSNKYIENICSFFKLTPSQTRYFELLVAFNNEKDPSHKEELLRKILAQRYSKASYRIEDKKLTFYQRWYYPVIRELVIMVDFQEDYNLLARLCKPRITAAQARGAVTYLINNNFIKKNRDGSYGQTHQVISTGAEVNSTILRKYYQQIMKHFAEAIDTEQRTNRDISSLTLSVSEETFQTIKKEIQDFRKRIMTIANNETKKPERVCLVGFQLIPRSEQVPNEKGDTQ